ncbi:MAG: DUF4412 domain-containing protein [Bacteroidales bacterium]|nr:DUF4412 domain-containing protein [Bacteroidales bacterium]
MMRKLIIGTTCFFLLLFGSNAYGGWIIHEQSYETGSKEKFSVVYYISDQKLKLVDGEVETIFNLNSNTILIIIPGQSVYWKGSPEELKHEIRLSLENSLDEKLKDVPVEKRDMLRKYYLEQINDKDPDKINSQIDALLVNTGKKEKIAGHISTRYALYVNMDLKEEFWISPEVPVTREFDMLRYKELLKKIYPGSGEMDYHSGSAYLQVLQTGLLMRTIEYTFGVKLITEVVKVKQKDLKPSEFSIPQKCKQVSYVELDFENLEN